MCCVIYYLYKKCQKYLRDCRKKEEVNKSLSKVVYNTKQLNDYVARRERGYWVID